MDNNYQIILEDSSNFINKKFSKLDIELNNSKNKDNISQIELILEEIENKLKSMKNDKNNLNESDKNIWEGNIKELKSKYEEYKKQYEDITKNKKEENHDPENIEESIDHNKLTIEEEYKRGKKILDEDNRIIGELIDIVSKDGETCIIIRKNLEEQGLKIEGISPQLKEIDFSLNRAGKKVKSMMKELLKDNFIKCLIAVISIIILTIIIISLCKGNNKNNNNNLPLDIFSSNSKDNGNKNNNTSYQCFLCLGNKFYYILFILLIFL